MSTFSFPTTEFPAYPSVSLTAPDGWSAAPTYDALVSLAGPNGSTVTVTARRTQTAPTIDGALSAALEEAIAQPDYNQFGQEQRDILGRPGFRHECTYTEDGEPTFQGTNVTVFEYGSYADVVTFTARCRAADAATLVPQLRAILASAVNE